MMPKKLGQFYIKTKIVINNYILYPMGFSDTIMHILDSKMLSVEMKYMGKRRINKNFFDIR